jgi:hypothetical protein
VPVVPVNQAELRKQILQIQRDGSLDSKGKARKIQVGFVFVSVFCVMEYGVINILPERIFKPTN